MRSSQLTLFVRDVEEGWVGKLSGFGVNVEIGNQRIAHDYLDAFRVVAVFFYFFQSAQLGCCYF
jgi:hypothetical protein